jgi:hypothetical protein
MMEKIDLKREWKQFYSPGRKAFEIVEVPEFTFLMVDGEGDPNTAQSYADAIQALYAVAYGLKFTCKKQLEKDFVVAPLEGLWWADDPAAFYSQLDKDSWQWTAMIHVPEWITAELFEQAVHDAGVKKELPALPLMRREPYQEGLSVQILHIGSYAAEAPTLLRLHQEFLPANGLVEAGKHHEIYLSDPRRTSPEKWKIVLRQPVRRVG